MLHIYTLSSECYNNYNNYAFLSWWVARQKWVNREQFWLQTVGLEILYICPHLQDIGRQYGLLTCSEHKHSLFNLKVFCIMNYWLPTAWNHKACRHFRHDFLYCLIYAVMYFSNIFCLHLYSKNYFLSSV